MKLSFPLLFLVVTTVVGTISVAAEPCNPNDGNGGEENYDMTKCNWCAEHGNGQGQCCDSIYHNSLGRDTSIFTNGIGYYCYDLGHSCTVGNDECYPGLTCAGNNDKNYFTGELTETCVLNADADKYTSGIGALVVTSSSSTTGTTTTTRVSAVVFVAGAAAVLIAMMKVVRHRVLLHRHQYSEVVEATATPIDV